MNNDIAQIIEKEIDCIVVDLNNKLWGVNTVSFREERHLEENRKEYVFELIVLEYANEDDYGPLLTIRLELKDDYELDLSVIRSFGEILDQKICKFTEQTVNYLDLHKVFCEMESSLLIVLQNLYLNKLE